ncbi:MAG: site-2 protease family protein [Anaerolineae bacterium]|nr:site-2 protease family protein [Anaerolineae bacterium]
MSEAPRLETLSSVSPETNSNDEFIRLRARVAEVMYVEQARTDSDTMATFTGKLRMDSDEAYRHLRQRLASMGYVPLLREGESDRQVVIAVKGNLTAEAPARVWLSLALFLATVVTTTIFGGLFAFSVSRPSGPLTLQAVLANGIPFSLTLLAILGMHELGHYIQARRHNLPVTLPYFIPVPLPGTLGTLGAFIQMRGAVENRRVLFDVGLGGPIAGLVVAVPLYVVGLLTSEIAPSPAPDNRSLLTQFLIALFLPEAIDNGIYLNPVLLAARFGLVVTAINLLPVGQLDGGHIAYAALGGTWARRLGLAVIGLMAVLGITASPSWFVWMAFALFSAAAQARPLDDITQLDTPRMLSFFGAVAILVAIFTARPL